MSSPAMLGGLRVERAHLSIPVVGPWWASAELVGTPAPEGEQTLSLGGVDWVGTVELGGGRLGDSVVILRAGGGGWGTALAARAYQDASGVRLSTVLTDAATAAGETLASGYTDEDIAEHYTRPAGPASSVLDGRVWHVGADGETVVDEREAAAVPTGYVVTDYRPDGGAITLTVESLIGIEPGCTIEVLDVGTVTLGALDIELGDELVVRSRAARVDAPTDSPIRDAVAALVRQAVRQALGIPGVHEYRIALLNGDRLDLVPVDASHGLPVLRAVPVMPGVPGASFDCDTGGRVLVAFIDGKRTRPVVVAFAGVDGEGFEPDSLAFSAGAINLAEALSTVVRFGDNVSVGTEAGPITFVPGIPNIPQVPVPGFTSLVKA